MTEFKVLSAIRTKNSVQLSPESLWSRVDVYAFGLLFLTLMLYQLQLLVPQFSSFHVREILYAYLYARVIFLHRVRPTKLFIATAIFLVLAVFIGLHTYYLYDAKVAVHGLTRFIHLVLLAPLASLILKNDTDVKFIFGLWLAVVFAGILTVVYQLIGGEMQWLVQKYIAIRGDLVRHKSLMGEPNVGGMAAVLAYAIASIVIRNIVCRYTVLFASSFLVIVCLSKAALASFFIVNVLLYGLDIYKNKKKRLCLPSKSFSCQIILIAGWFVLLSFVPLLDRYMEVAINSFIGRQAAVPGAIDDFSDRFISGRYGANFMSKEFFASTLRYLFGGSFGLAGSAALELNVPNAVGPHNMYLEVFLVGGLVFLFSFFSVQILTLVTILRKIKANRLVYQAALCIFFLTCLYMTEYPIIYEPITGSLFWLIIGVCARPELYGSDSKTTMRVD